MLPHSYATLPRLSRQNSPRAAKSSLADAASASAAACPKRLGGGAHRDATSGGGIRTQRRLRTAERLRLCRSGRLSHPRRARASYGRVAGEPQAGRAGVARHIKKPLPEARAAALSGKLRLRISGGAWRRRGACCSMSSWSAWRCGASSSSCASICERA